MDNTTVFSTRGESYDRARPGYPEALIDYLYSDQLFSKASAIADIGSGTGKFAQQLLARGSRVFCVEPNDEMRQIAERKLSYYQGFISVEGTASFSGISHRLSGQLKCTVDRFYAAAYPSKPPKLRKVAMFLSSGDPDMYEGAMFSYQGDFLDYLKLEDMGVFTTNGYDPGVPEEKLEEIRAFGAGLK